MDDQSDASTVVNDDGEKEDTDSEDVVHNVGYTPNIYANNTKTGEEVNYQVSGKRSFCLSQKKIFVQYSKSVVKLRISVDSISSSAVKC